MKISKTRAVLLVAFVALCLFMGVIYNDILRITNTLDTLYWVSENTHSGVVTVMIREAKSALNRRVTVLSLLIVATAFVAIIGLTGIKHKPKKITSRIGQCLIAFLISLLFPIVS